MPDQQPRARCEQSAEKDIDQMKAGPRVEVYVVSYTVAYDLVS